MKNKLQDLVLSIINLSDDDIKILLNALENTQKPNDKLKEASEKYKEQLADRVSEKHGKVDMKEQELVYGYPNCKEDKASPIINVMNSVPNIDAELNNKCNHCGVRSHKLKEMYITDIESVDYGPYQICPNCEDHYESDYNTYLDQANEGGDVWRGTREISGEVAHTFEMKARKNEYKQYLSNLGRHMTFDQWLRQRT